MLNKMLENIKDRVDNETDPPAVLYADIKKLGAYMMLTNTLNQDLTESFCSKLLKMYLLLRK